MSQKFEEHICKYIQDQAEILKSYPLAILDSKDQCLYYLDSRLGTSLPSMDIRNCEFLTDARLFREEIKLTQDGRNRYKLFYLTPLGKEIAKNIREESLTDQMPETPQIVAPTNDQTSDFVNK
jgi:hypothetical protein